VTDGLDHRQAARKPIGVGMGPRHWGGGEARPKGGAKPGRRR
jgi:hypothetical protein